ncbi:CD99 antigen-like protein 2 isoform X6 [Stegostoma tigrinum]|uniref:CD99 antigen-like protein 2 isoform X6 n=1 Tax=Stegostoma tigrinum TaxID=3053191 RepID=UPI0028706C49|nr:CD99 antigen-like protein 2 isoform X6 [Stegostoma tigrinum]
MANVLRVILLCATFTLLTGRVIGDSDEFDLFDALPDDITTKPPPAKPRNPSGGTGAGDFNLWDLIQTTPAPRKPTKSPKKPPKKGDTDMNDFDLSDALDDRNDNPGKGGNDDSDHPSVPGSKGNDKPKGGKKMGTSDLSDKDLEDLLGGGDYKPDKKKSGDDIPPGDQDQGSLNQQYVKGENAEAGAMSEPQAERSLLQAQSEKPPAHNIHQV